MARDKEVFYDLPVTANPNYRRYKDTNFYLSKMGDVVKVVNGKEYRNVITYANGQQVFNICGNNKEYKRSVGRAIYETFVGEVSKDERIVHINRVNTDNRLSNLKKLSIKQAMKYTHKKRKDKLIHNLKTNEVFNCADECGKAYGYTGDVIRRICNGTYPHDNGLKLKFVTEDEALKIGDDLKLYSVYKDGKFMITGTKDECTRFMGWAENTLWMYMCKSHKNLYKNKRISVLEV